MVWLCWAAWLGGRGHRVQVWWGGWSLVAGPLAVRGSPERSRGRPSGVCQYVVVLGLRSPGAGCVGLECRNQRLMVVWCFGGVGASLSGPSQWRGERCVWATRGLLRLRGPRVGESRHLGRVVAPVWRPRIVSGGVWLGCIVSTVGGGHGLGCGVAPW